MEGNKGVEEVLEDQQSLQSLSLQLCVLPLWHGNWLQLCLECSIRLSHWPPPWCLYPVWNVSSQASWVVHLLIHWCACYLGWLRCLHQSPQANDLAVLWGTSSQKTEFCCWSLCPSGSNISLQWSVLCSSILPFLGAWISKLGSRVHLPSQSDGLSLCNLYHRSEVCGALQSWTRDKTLNLPSYRSWEQVWGILSSYII